MPSSLSRRYCFSCVALPTCSPAWWRARPIPRRDGVRDADATARRWTTSQSTRQRNTATRTYFPWCYAVRGPLGVAFFAESLQELKLDPLTSTGEMLSLMPANNRIAIVGAASLRGKELNE